MLLNAEERSVILSDWSEATRDKSLFDLYPEYQLLFRDFKGRSRPELSDHSRLKAHGMRMVNTLEAAIQNLDDIDVCSSAFEMIGSSHRGRGVQVQHFEDMNQVLLLILERQLGADKFELHRDAWQKLLNSVLPVMQRGLI